MRAADLVGSAISNTFRAKTRTILTILAIFVGAFTLALTGGLGTGINRYIDDTVSGVGAADAMSVTRAADDAATVPGATGGEPREYDPDAVSSGIPGQTVIALDPDDVAEIEGISAGGMPTRVKCLHALAGHALAAGRGVNPIGDAALERSSWSPEECRCDEPGAALRDVEASSA